ncbi:hypothetical protein [Hymenobacter sp. BT491]|uniref:hypothetical protein n=1 Tax=Hymenobacter sp. BT491 TaxID=2766779 RepID=UPI00165394E0|nr:hypothetical protein [Hymenobacter sp. BT491]MBC6991853.1 hypothetical protein [Hymenobacter sp. BT491]
MHSIDLTYVRLNYRSDLEVLFVRWTQPVGSEEHRAGYHAALELAKTTGAMRWQIDLRSRGLASAEDFEWVLTTFRAALLASLGGRPARIAYLVAPYHLELLNERLQKAEAAPGQPQLQQVHFKTFTGEQSAQQWLSDPVLQNVSAGALTPPPTDSGALSTE